MIPLLSMKILYRGIFIATFKRTFIQDQARPIIVTSLLSYETSPYFSWREKSLLPTFLSQLEPCFVVHQPNMSHLVTYSNISLEKMSLHHSCWSIIVLAADWSIPRHSVTFLNIRLEKIPLHHLFLNIKTTLPNLSADTLSLILTGQ